MDDAKSDGPGAVETVRRELLPLFDELASELAAEDNAAALEFFRSIGSRIAGAQAEHELLQPFHELSLSALVVLRFPVGMAAQRTIDALLARAHLIAWTLSAEPQPQ